MLNGMDLKIHRIKQNIKAREIASLLKVSSAMVTYMETGKRVISDDNYKKWIEFLGVKNN
jgi:transcriptional regulator with XRE-family HTH domain